MLAILFGSSILIKSINVPIIFIITLIFACQKILPTLQQIYRITSYVFTYSYCVMICLISFIQKKFIRKKLSL